MTINDTSLSANGYQLLPLATTQLVGNNREFDVSGIFLPVLLIVGEGKLITIEHPLLRPIITNCCHYRNIFYPGEIPAFPWFCLLRCCDVWEIPVLNDFGWELAAFLYKI